MSTNNGSTFVSCPVFFGGEVTFQSLINSQNVMALIIKSFPNRFNISEVSPEDSPTNSSPEDKSDSPPNTWFISEVLTPSKVGVRSRSANFSQLSSGAHRVIIAAKDLSTIVNNKVSLHTIFLTIACCMFPSTKLNCSDLDISSKMTPIRANQGSQ